MIDAHIPRFAQGVQALLLSLAFLLQAAWVVPLLGAILLAAAVGGPRLNLFAHLYRALPLPPGPLEPAAPPRFAQSIGTAFLLTGAIGLYSAAHQSTAWWVLGWGPAIVVAALSALAATTSFCLGCEIYLLMQRARAQ